MNTETKKPVKSVSPTIKSVSENIRAVSSEIAERQSRPRYEKKGVLKDYRGEKQRMPVYESTEKLEPGEVKFYHPGRGFGFLVAADGDVYFHIYQHRVPEVRGAKVVLVEMDEETVRQNREQRQSEFENLIVPGTRILFFPGTNNRGRLAQAWCFQHDFEEAQHEVAAMPVYRLVRVDKKLGPLAADNDTKDFTRKEIEVTHHTAWIGADLNELRVFLQLNPPVDQITQNGGEVKDEMGPITIKGFQWKYENCVEGDWIDCKNPLSNHQD